MNRFCEYIVRPVFMIVGAIITAILCIPILGHFLPATRNEGIFAGGLSVAVGAIAGLKVYRLIEAVVVRRHKNRCTIEVDADIE